MGDSMRVAGKTTIGTVKHLRGIRMATVIMETLLKGKLRAKVCILGQMARFMMVVGCKV